ncbi:MAG: hypothetical protein ACM3O3_09795 [Syntrophothermus sp.]
MGKYIDLLKKRKVGRPPKFEDPQEIYSLFIDFLIYCDEHNLVPTISLFYAQNFISRHDIYKYEEKEDFSAIIETVFNYFEHITINSSLDPATKKSLLQKYFKYLDVAKNENNNNNKNEIIITGLVEEWSK